jgi:hypothetical protein
MSPQESKISIGENFTAGAIVVIADTRNTANIAVSTLCLVDGVSRRNI